MSLGVRLSLGPEQLWPGRGCQGAAAPVGGCFLRLCLQAWLWQQNRKAVEGAWWEEGQSTARRGRRTLVLHPFRPPPGCVALAGDKGQASVSSFG